MVAPMLTFGQRSLAEVLVAAVVLGALVSACGTFPDPGASPVTETPPAPIGTVFLQSEGVLYMRLESDEHQLGVSNVRGGGEDGPLATVIEEWLDAANPWRFRAETHEILDDRPELAWATGSDGSTGWWEFDVTLRAEGVRHHDGRSPRLEGAPNSTTELAFTDNIDMFRQGRLLIEMLARGEVEQLSSGDRPPWGKVLTLRHFESRTNHTTMASVRANAPHLLLDSLKVDSGGKPFRSSRITHWLWLDAEDLGPDFWMTPPDLPAQAGG